MIRCGWYVKRHTKYGDMCSVEYDWGESVLTKYFGTHREALKFVEKYKKRIKEEKWKLNLKESLKKYYVPMVLKENRMKDKDIDVIVYEIEAHSTYEANMAAIKKHPKMELF